MAGADPTGEFNAAETRAELQETMKMGLPNDVALQPTFFFPTDDTFEHASMSGAPWNWEDDPLENDPDRAPVRVMCAVEVDGAAVDLTTVGNFNPQRAVLTLLDVDYAKVRGFHEMTMMGAVYRYSRLIQAIGLFDMTTYQVEVEARDRP